MEIKRNITERNTPNMLYLSLDWSQLSYGVLVQGRYSLTFINTIRVTQNSSVRNIYGYANSNINKLNNLLLFNKTYDLHDLLKLSKEINMPNQSNSYFIERVQELDANNCYMLQHKIYK